MTAAHSGGAGDIIYSIPVMRKLNIDTLYVKESFYPDPYGSMFTFVKPFLETQGFKILPTSGAYPFHEYDPNTHFDIDLDIARNMPARGTRHIIWNYLSCFKFPTAGYTSPWLTRPHFAEKIMTGYDFVFLTNRWRDRSVVNWSKILPKMQNPIFFGFDQDHKDFVNRYGYVPYVFTRDLLVMAFYLINANRVFCNQSVALTLAQGFGKPYFCEFKPGKLNCRLFTKNEFLLV